MNHEKLISFLESPKCILKKSKEELRTLLGKDFSMMKGYSQNNPHHCYDLLEHTLRTVETIDCTGLSKNETIELKMAALYHDVGKPIVAFEKNGKTVFYNHAIESRRIAEKELKNLGLDNNVINRILFYIEYHDSFISFKCPDEIKDKNNKFITPIEKKTVESKIVSIQNDCKVKGSYIPTKKDFILLLRLCLADVEAQSSEVIQKGRLIDLKDLKVKRLKKILKIIEK